MEKFLVKCNLTDKQSVQLEMIQLLPGCLLTKRDSLKSFNYFIHCCFRILLGIVEFTRNGIIFVEKPTWIMIARNGFKDEKMKALKDILLD